MNLFLRCEFVAKLYKPLVLLNDCIDLFTQQAKLNLETIQTRLNNFLILNLFFFSLVDREVESTFMTIFANCLIRLTNQEYKLSQQSSDILTLNKLRSSSLNWLINFMAMIKSIASKADTNPKSVELSIRIFSTVCYAWSKEISEVKSWHQFEIEPIWADFHVNLNTLMHKSNFKNIEIKMFEWLISLLNLQTLVASNVRYKIESNQNFNRFLA
jgi:hypothetical protein